MTTYPSDIPYNYGLALASDLDYITPMMNEIKERNEKMVANHTAPQPSLSTKFHLDINLDDPADLENFLDVLAIPGSLSEQAARVGLSGKGSRAAFQALRAYARNKVQAIHAREDGKILDAQGFERICDSIYHNDILPRIECW